MRADKTGGLSMGQGDEGFGRHRKDYVMRVKSRTKASKQP